jgi:hypothetical protein
MSDKTKHEFITKERAAQIVNAEAQALIEYYKSPEAKRQYGLSPEGCASIIEKFRANLVYLLDGKK